MGDRDGGASCSVDGDCSSGECDVTGCRLEVRHDSRWGSICDDAFDTLDANVACTQLGFGAGLDIAAFGRSYSRSAGPIWLDEMDCSGNESDVGRCRHLRGVFTTAVMPRTLACVVMIHRFTAVRF